MKIFISYKRNVSPDQSLAEAIEAELKGAGHSVFRDETGIQSGVEWGAVIWKHLEESDVVIALISNLSLQSTWVLNEIDRARDRRKLLIPVVLEKLGEALEFQVYRPRFMQIQHYTFRGDSKQAGADLCRRLEQSPALFESQFFASPSVAVDADDDSENPEASAYFRKNSHLAVDGKYRVSLSDVVQLAILRSAYYQQHLRASTAPPAEAPSPLDLQAFLAFRQGFYTWIAIGDFGTSGFVRAERRPDGEHMQELSGYLGLLSLRQQIRALEEILASLSRQLEFLNVRWQAGRITVLQVQEHRQTMSAKEMALREARESLDDRVDHFKVFRLGLPAETMLEIEDPICNPVALEDVEIRRATERIERFYNELSDSIRNLSEKQLDDLGPQVVKVQKTVEALFPQMRAEVERIPPDRMRPMSDDPDSNTRQTVRAFLAKNLDDLQRQLFEFADMGTTHQPYDEEDARRIREDKVLQPIRTAMMSLEQMATVLAQIRLEAWTIPEVTMSLDEAMALAQAHRADRDMLESNISLRREVRLTLRRVLRDLDRSAKRLTHFRQVTSTALELWYMSQLYIAVGREAMDHAIPPRVHYLESRGQLTAAWLQHHAARMRLARETGRMQIDDAGLWIE